MKQVFTAIQAALLIAVLVMQVAGPWCCLAEDAACCSITEQADEASQHGCCGSESEREDAPVCCDEPAPEPQMLSIVKKFQQAEPVPADLPYWGVPSSEERPLAKESSRRFIAGIEPPPGHSVLTARRCVRQI